MKGFEQFSNDFIAMGAGFVGAVAKGIKNKLGFKLTTISAIAGAFMCYATVGIIEKYFSDVPPKLTITIAFFVGFVANTITDHADQFVKDMYDIAVKKLGSKTQKTDESK